MGIGTISQAPGVVSKRELMGDPSGFHSTVDIGNMMRTEHTGCHMTQSLKQCEEEAGVGQRYLFVPPSKKLQNWPSN